MLSRLIRISALLLSTATMAVATPSALGQVPGELDTGFNPSPNNTIEEVLVQPDGKILVSGIFNSIAGQARDYLVRLNPNGTLDTAFNPTVDGQVKALALLPDGKILIGGAFSSVNGTTQIRLARLNSDGSLDSTFTSPNPNSDIRAMRVQPDGKILIGGLFTSVGGTTRDAVARLNADGTPDTSFTDPGLDNTPIVNGITLLPDGRIVLGGNFDNTQTSARDVVLLSQDGTLVTSFNANVVQPAVVYSVLARGDGKVFLGGSFSQVGSPPQARGALALVDTTGALDSFNPGFSYFSGPVINSMVQQFDGQLLTGGEFDSVGGTPRNSLARLNPDGTADAFNPGLGSLSTVYSIALQPDGKVVLGGSFSQVGGEFRNYLARVLATTPQAAPTGVTATAGVGKAEVSWTAVPGEISGYTATVDPGGETCSATFSPTCTVTGLTAGTTYSVTVRARNPFGPGPASSRSNRVTPPAVSVSSVQRKVTRKAVLVTSRVRVSESGRIAQRATTGSGRLKTWCQASKSAGAAGTYALKCNLGRKGRKALRKNSLKLTLRTTFTTGSGVAVSANRKVTIKRKR